MRKGYSKSYRADNIKRFPVSEGTTLLPFLFSIMPDMSRTEVKNLLKYEHVALKGEVVTQFDTPLLPDDVVEINFGRPFYKFNDPYVNILYEDEWLVVIEKASGLLSVANDNSRDNNAFRIVRDYVRNCNPESRLYICHRLDQYTSGILVFSKDEDLMRELRSNWDFYIKERKYMCVTENVPAIPEDTIRSYLIENSRMQMCSTNDSEQGQLAVTHYRVIQSRDRYALIDVEIFTGKKNQIRVHMSDLGCPIAGDRKYGAETNPGRRLMLHNYRFTFIHPVTGELMRFSLSTPQIFRKLTQ